MKKTFFFLICCCTISLLKVNGQVEENSSGLTSNKKVISASDTSAMDARITSLSEVTIRAVTSNVLFKSISELDIQLRPASNSQEVLRFVPGLFVAQHAGGGKAEQIFLRGFDIDHGTDIHISVDGVPVNMVSHAHGQGYADLHFIIPELIRNINFNKGPYFADKGNFTTAGFVEFTTKDYLTENFVKLEGGQFGAIRAVTGINLLKSSNENSIQNLYIAGEAGLLKGYFDSPQHLSRFNGILKYHCKFGLNQTLSATLSGFSSKWNASGQIPERAFKKGIIGFFGAIDDNEGGHSSRYNAAIELNSIKNRSKIHQQLYYSLYDFELYSNFTFFKEDPVNGDQVRQKENRYIFGYNGSFMREGIIGDATTQTSAGIQIRYDHINDSELTRTRDRTVNISRISKGDINELNVGFHITERISSSKKFNMSFAVRGDYFHNFYRDKLNPQQLSAHTAILSPKLELNYRPGPRVQLYFYSGKGFHSNDTRVVVLQNGKKVLPPAFGYDLGGKIILGNKCIIQSAIWYLWLDQEFIYAGDQGIVEPGGKTKRRGLDFSVRYELLKNLFADTDVNISDPKMAGVDKSESFLPLAPRFTSTGGFTYRQQTGLNGSLRYRLMSKRPANEYNSLQAKGYVIIDAGLNFIKKKWEAGLAIQNLLNSKWKETQFETESRLQNETVPSSEIHFTPGSPFFARVHLTILF